MMGQLLRVGSSEPITLAPADSFPSAPTFKTNYLMAKNYLHLLVILKSFIFADSRLRHDVHHNYLLDYDGFDLCIRNDFVMVVVGCILGFRAVIEV